MSAKIQAILNVTPDSFSDGGFFVDPLPALEHVTQLLENGADYIDVGAESTRPGSKPVNAAEEWERLSPILEALFSKIDPQKFSIDTRHEKTALKVAEMGVRFINNVYGLFDDKVMKTLATFTDMKYCAMHMHKTPETMQMKPLNEMETLSEVDDFFSVCYQKMTGFGFSHENILLDPGVGFGKSDAGNFALLKRAAGWSKQYRLLYGVSRKSFIGRTWGIEDPRDRDGKSKEIENKLIEDGVSIIRTHNPIGIKR